MSGRAQGGLLGGKANWRGPLNDTFNAQHEMALGRVRLSLRIA
jgi:hypothetical protein